MQGKIEIQPCVSTGHRLFGASSQIVSRYFLPGAADIECWLNLNEERGRGGRVRKAAKRRGHRFRFIDVTIENCHVWSGCNDKLGIDWVQTAIAELRLLEISKSHCKKKADS